LYNIDQVSNIMKYVNCLVYPLDSWNCRHWYH